MSKLNAYYFFATLITSNLTILRIIGQIDWSWMLIVLPIVIPPVLLTIVVICVIIAMYCFEYYKRLKAKL